MILKIKTLAVITHIQDKLIVIQIPLTEKI